MGGKHIVVDRSKFEAAIAELESQKTFENMFQLQEAVAKSPYGLSVGIKTGNVYQYIRKWNVQIKTKAGKRGAALARLHDKTNVVKMTRGEKIENDPKAQTWIQGVRREVKSLCGHNAGRFAKVLDRLEKGSLKAAIAVQCITCSGGDTNEVKHCACTACPLYQFRPYKENDDSLAILEIGEDSDLQSVATTL
jgi:hypothetical protein